MKLHSDVGTNELLMHEEKQTVVFRSSDFTFYKAGFMFGEVSSRDAFVAFHPSRTSRRSVVLNRVLFGRSLF